MQNWNSADGSSFGVFVVVIFVGFIAFIIYRRMVRRRSLHRRDDGLYVWTEWHGGERSSLQDPSRPGGEWDSSGDGGGDGGGD